MKKALKFAEEMAKKVSQTTGREICTIIPNHSSQEPTPKETAAKVKKKTSSSNRSPKKMTCRWEIEGSTPHSLIFALSKMQSDSKEKSPPSPFETFSPLYSRRTLWIDCDERIAITEKIGFALPSHLTNCEDHTFDKFCRTLLELGFNSLIYGEREENLSEIMNSNEINPKKESSGGKLLDRLIRAFDEYGIDLIIKPSLYLPKEFPPSPISPIDHTFRHLIEEALTDLQNNAPSLKNIFWQSLYLEDDFQYHPSGRKATKLEKCSAELKLLEKTLRRDINLIYHLPTLDEKGAEKEIKWIGRLLQQFGPKSSFAFSLLAGPPHSDHLPTHPIIDKLSSLKDSSPTPLLPILNSASVRQGDGYWPNFPLDIYDEHLPPSAREKIDGLIHLANNLPKKGSFADCCLFAAGESMWNATSSKELLKRWYKKYFGEENFALFFSLVKRARRVALELSYLRSTESKSQQILQSSLESTLYSIIEAETITKENGKFHHYSKGGIRESFLLFLKDARRILHHTARKYNLSLQKNESKELQGTGLFTTLSSHGLAIQCVELLKKPLIGDEGTPSHKVHWEANIDA